jgi:hypothetical protein
MIAIAGKARRSTVAPVPLLDPIAYVPVYAAEARRDWAAVSPQAPHTTCVPGIVAASDMPAQLAVAIRLVQDVHHYLCTRAEGTSTAGLWGASWARRSAPTPGLVPITAATALA